VRRVLEAGCIILLVGLGWLSFCDASYFHIKKNLFFRHPLLTLPLFGLALRAMSLRLGRSQAVRLAAHLLAVTLAAGVALACIFDDGWGYTASGHFTAAFNAVVQVYLGKGLLIDCTSQYGLYPELLRPIFTVWGLSVVKFTVLMGLLTAGAFLVLWAVLCRAVVNPLTACFGFFSLVFNAWLYAHTPGAGSGAFFDPYFQYFPIRFLFPASLVWLAWRYFHAPGPRLYWGALIWLSVGVLWNLDSGLPALGSWVLALGFAELFGPRVRRRIGRTLGHLIAAALVLATVAGLFGAATYLRHGVWPDFTLVLHYQRLFYLTGFFMIPMRLHGTWMMVLLVYLAGLAYAFNALAAGRDTPRVKFMFLVAVLGLGLFTYYEGRSHRVVLTLVWWPSFLLLTVFLEELVARVETGSRRLLDWFLAGLLGWLLAGFAGTVFGEVPFLADLIHRQWPRAEAPSTISVRQEAAVLKANVRPGERLIIISPREALYHLLSGVPQAGRCSQVEMVLLEDYVELRRLLEQEPAVKVFVDKNILANEADQNRGLQILLDAVLHGGYRVRAETGSSYLFGKEELLFPRRGGAVKSHDDRETP
jgi:hypothetical protein